MVVFGQEIVDRYILSIYSGVKMSTNNLKKFREEVCLKDGKLFLLKGE